MSRREYFQDQQSVFQDEMYIIVRDDRTQFRPDTEPALDTEIYIATQANTDKGGVNAFGNYVASTPNPHINSIYQNAADMGDLLTAEAYLKSTEPAYDENGNYQHWVTRSYVENFFGGGPILETQPTGNGYTDVVINNGGPGNLGLSAGRNGLSMRTNNGAPSASPLNAFSAYDNNAVNDIYSFNNISSGSGLSLSLPTGGDLTSNAINGYFSLGSTDSSTNGIYANGIGLNNGNNLGGWSTPFEVYNTNAKTGNDNWDELDNTPPGGLYSSSYGTNQYRKSLFN